MVSKYQVLWYRVAHHELKRNNFYLQTFSFSDDFSDDASYVDLVINPERYTGYSGRSPHRIWSAIYNENCFRLVITMVTIHVCTCTKFIGLSMNN